MTARQGMGKTTFLRAQIERWQALEKTVGGILAPVVIQSGRRVGYDLLDIWAGHQLPLARTAPEPVAGAGGCPFRFYEEALELGTRAIMQAVREGLDIVVIDEIGPLELGGGGWAAALEFTLLHSTSAQELILVVRPSIVEQVPARFPDRRWLAARHITSPWPAELRF
ncbi:MAG: nucleoside-triphosphatase [Planctomycetota bacterium]